MPAYGVKDTRQDSVRVGRGDKSIDTNLTGQAIEVCVISAGRREIWGQPTLDACVQWVSKKDCFLLP